MPHKVKTFFKVVGHTVLSFIAALSGGFMFYAFIQPIVGSERYRRIPHDPVMVALLLGIVLLGGVLAYRRWGDPSAFFAWVVPALWVCHLVLSRGIAAMEGQWLDNMFFFAISAAYSAGAFVAAIVGRKRLTKPPVFS